MNFTPSRLTFGRMRRGLSKTQLAGDAQVTVRSIKLFESGTKRPGADTVARLADCLRVPVEFFCAPPIRAVNRKEPSFRRTSSLRASDRDAVLAAAELAWQFGQLIAEHFDLPSVDVPDLAGQEPEVAAAELRSEWGLGNKSISNMVHLLESRGVRVFSLAQDCTDVDAFCFWRDDQPVVYLNMGKSGERGRFDAAHELGHLVLHRGTENRGREVENEANRFASAFLMPEGSVIPFTPRVLSLDRLVQLKTIWGVSPGALARRFYDLGLVTDWQYRQACIEISRAGLRKAERNPIPRERSGIFEQTLPMLHKEGISMASLAKRLAVHADDLAEFAFGFARVALSGGGQRTTSPESRPPTLRLITPDGGADRSD